MNIPSETVNSIAILLTLLVLSVAGQETSPYTDPGMNTDYDDSTDDPDVAAEREYPTPFANSPLLPSLLESLKTQKHTPNIETDFYPEYDYIIVGAGSAGSVVAGRLSELPCVSILLLEAGKPPPRLTEVPATTRAFWFTDIDWAYRTAPQKYTGDGLVNREVLWPSGKALGGSSSINGNVYVRGNKKNYNDWADQGAEGWSYEDVLPYFKKMEDNRNPEFVANGFHGVDGPVTVQQPLYTSEIKDPVLQAAVTLGFDIVDTNGDQATGFTDFQGTLRNGQKCGTAKAYLVPAEDRDNLDIVPNSMVRKVLIENGRATGVQFDYEGETVEVRARIEVILSAGAINSAQLLMLSGIGPREELERFQIPIVADLPVGQNLQDHPSLNLNYVVDPSIPGPFSKLLNPENIETYIQNRTGILTSTELVSVMAFLGNDSFAFDETFPSYQLYFAEADASALEMYLGMRPEVFEQVYGPYRNQTFVTCFVSVLQPKSRGTVVLRSTDPYDPPIIDPNFFEDPRDIDDLVEGMKTCDRIYASDALRNAVGSTPFETFYPGCEQFADDQEQNFRCIAKSVIQSLSHQVGTAKMGNTTDPTTVVDPELRVKGIDGLRVVDASIMPIVPSGNTNVPTIMVAEKASDIIKSTVSCEG